MKEGDVKICEDHGVVYSWQVGVPVGKVPGCHAPQMFSRVWFILSIWPSAAEGSFGRGINCVALEQRSNTVMFPLDALKQLQGQRTTKITL